MPIDQDLIKDLSLTWQVSGNVNCYMIMQTLIMCCFSSSPCLFVHAYLLIFFFLEGGGG